MGAIEIMTPKMVEAMRVSCQLAADTLLMVSEHIKPGITTEAINTLVHEYTLAHDAVPSPLNYGQPPFPKSVCTSVNACVCHGIPSADVVLQNGDIVNVDVTSYFPTERGYHGDTSVTFYVGEPSDEAKHVVETARHCLELGIATVREGARIYDIGAAIEEYAHSVGCSVVEQFVGHGIGRQFHMPPQIPHYYDKRARRRIKAGMVFTIEPMINLGGYEIEVLDDHWTVLTKDRSLSAQFEHTILVTKDGCEVLTSRKTPLKNSEDRAWNKLGPLSTAAAYAAQSSD